MEVLVYDMAGQEVERIELPAVIFEADINRGLMHQALVRQMAHARAGTHSTKGRSEVDYTTAKLYRQKGTGRARHGSKRAPIFVGGGVAHGPKPRTYQKKMPRQMRRAALRGALTAKAQNGDLVMLESISMDRPKTKEAVAMMQRLVDRDESVLVLLPGRDENVEKSIRNVANMKVLHANYLNIRDLLGYDKIVMTLDALAVIEEFLGEITEYYVWAEDGEEE